MKLKSIRFSSLTSMIYRAEQWRLVNTNLVAEQKFPIVVVLFVVAIKSF